MKKNLIAFAIVVVAVLSVWHFQPKANATSSTNEIAANGNEKVTICHRTGNGSSHAITVSIHAVPAHMAHGDAIGDCSDGKKDKGSNYSAE